MCHRLIKLNKHVECGHSSLFSKEDVDCLQRVCYLSRVHPADCGANGKAPCNCRRYWTQPDRLYHDVPGKCEQCLASQ